MCESVGVYCGLVVRCVSSLCLWGVSVGCVVCNLCTVCWLCICYMRVCTASGVEVRA